jgi:hypothetical protein
MTLFRMKMNRLAAALMLALLASATPARGQALPGAEANQLHAAIENGDVDALRYWLTARHVDSNATPASQSDLTPLAHCLRLAARVLDGPASPPAGGTVQATPAVGLRVLQDMVTLLDEHGARLADSDRQRFSAPVIRWYEDAVSRRVSATGPTTATAPAETAATPEAPPVPSTTPTQPSNAADSDEAGPFSRKGLVVLVLDPRKECNHTGHMVFIENRMLLGARVTVSTHEDAKGPSKAKSRTDTYAVDPQGSWALGCDVTRDGAPVRYVLDSWQ